MKSSFEWDVVERHNTIALSLKATKQVDSLSQNTVASFANEIVRNFKFGGKPTAFFNGTCSFDPNNQPKR